MRTIRFVSALALSTVMLALAPLPSFAQATDVPRSASAAAPQQQISASPFLLMWDYFNVEFERRATTASTWGVSTSFAPRDDGNYRNVGAFWHFYPGGTALRGFYLGGRVQIHHATGLNQSATLGGVGFELGKNWIVGRRTLVGLGVGATRLFGGPLAGDSLTLPTFRIANVGITF